MIISIEEEPVGKLQILERVIKEKCRTVTAKETETRQRLEPETQAPSSSPASSSR